MIPSACIWLPLLALHSLTGIVRINGSKAYQYKDGLIMQVLERRDTLIAWGRAPGLGETAIHQRTNYCLRQRVARGNIPPPPERKTPESNASESEKYSEFVFVRLAITS